MHWPLNTRPTRAVSVPRSASSLATTTVTASATIHTKGPWTQIHASTPETAKMAILYLGGVNLSAAATDLSVDIGIGAAGFEQVILADVLAGYTGTVSGMATLALPLPLSIPAGSRISARCQALIASDTVSVGLELYGGTPWEGYSSSSRCVTYGFVPSTSKGTLVTSGAVNAKGNWSDITLSTTEALDVLAMTVQPDSRIIASTEVWTADVGVWNGTSYDVIWPDMNFRYSSSEEVNARLPPVNNIGYALPVGSRLGVRASNTVGALTIDVVLIGIG